MRNSRHSQRIAQVRAWRLLSSVHAAAPRGIRVQLRHTSEVSRICGFGRESPKTPRFGRVEHPASARRHSPRPGTSRSSCLPQRSADVAARFAGLCGSADRSSARVKTSAHTQQHFTMVFQKSKGGTKTRNSGLFREIYCSYPRTTSSGYSTMAAGSRSCAYHAWIAHVPTCTVRGSVQ